MRTFYNILITFVAVALKITALFNKKMAVFVKGRKNVFDQLASKIGPGDKVIWFHCASLGEFEQAVPVIENVRKLYASHKILVSFFSPSGYEIKKNTPLADVVVYLPMDTKRNVKKFLSHAHPDMVFFVKYEFWPNYLYRLQALQIPTFLISGIFRKNQLFFSKYGKFMRKALDAFTYFFVQNSESLHLIQALGYNNAILSGDTRFDRVSQQLKHDNHVAFAENFTKERTSIVCGSTWQEDEALLLDFMNSASEEVCFIVAPHKIDKEKIELFRNQLKKKSVLFSEVNEETKLQEFKILIIDCIGLLSKLYVYADIAYVGGAAGNTGLHNILEPATFGVPIVIGKNYDKFPEAIELKEKGGLFSVSTSEETSAIMEKLIFDISLRKQTGEISGNYIRENKGATEKITTYLKQNFTEK